MQCVCLGHIYLSSILFFFPRQDRAFFLIPFTVAPLDWVQGPWWGQHKAGALDMTEPGQARLKVSGAQKHAGVTFLSQALSTCYLVQDEGSLEK